MKSQFPPSTVTTLLFAITAIPCIVKADIELAFSEDGSLPDLCVAQGQEIEVPVFLIQVGDPIQGGDLNTDGIVSMGVQLEFDSDADSASVVTASQEASFFELQLSEMQIGEAALAGAIDFTAPPKTGSSILLGTFTFQAGEPGNVTSIAATLPDILSVQGPYVISGSDPPLPLDSMIGTSVAVTTITSDFELGDVNRDGNVNLLDIAPFVDVISSGLFQCEADLNFDGVVNLLDVEPFIDVLSG
jgi:hypothetical protein